MNPTQRPTQTEEAGPVRVALVHYRDDPSAGGSLRVGEALASHLDRSRYEPHLVFAYGNEGAVSRAFEGASTFLRADGPLEPAAWLRARSFFNRLNFDVAHFIDPVNWLRASLWGTRAKKIVHVHGRFLPDYVTPGTRLLNRMMVDGADARVCVTHGAMRSLEDLGWTGDGNNFVVHNGIDCELFGTTEDRAAARAALGLPEDALVMGMACRLVKHRGVQDALRLLTMLPLKWRLVVCGNGPFRADLEAQAAALGVRERTCFTGLLDDVRPVYACMDAYLFLARYDTFGIATAEAMASGVPVVGLAGDGEYREREYPLVTEENATLLERVAPMDYDAIEPDTTLCALASTLTSLLADSARCGAQVRAARHWVESRFSARRQAEKMAAIYSAIVSASGRCIELEGG